VIWDWAKIGLIILQIADKVLDIARSKQQMDAGAEREIARASASVLAKTSVAKEIWAEVQAKSEAEVDKGLKELEP